MHRDRKHYSENLQRQIRENELARIKERKAFFEEIVNGDPDPIEMLRNGDTEGVRALIRERQDVAETLFTAS